MCSFEIELIVSEALGQTMPGGYKPKATMGPQKGLTRYQKQQKGKQGQSSVRLQGMSERSTGSRREVPFRPLLWLYHTFNTDFHMLTPLSP